MKKLIRFNYIYDYRAYLGTAFTLLAEVYTPEDNSWELMRQCLDVKCSPQSGVYCHSATRQ